MPVPDYIPEGEEHKFGIVPGAGPGQARGVMRDFIPDPEEDGTSGPAPPNLDAAAPPPPPSALEKQFPELLTAPLLPEHFRPEEAEEAAPPPPPPPEPEPEEEKPPPKAKRPTEAEVAESSPAHEEATEPPPAEETDEDLHGFDAEHHELLAKFKAALKEKGRLGGEADEEAGEEDQPPEADDEPAPKPKNKGGRPKKK